LNHPFAAQAAFSKIAARAEGGEDAVLDHALKMMEETGRGESLRAVDDVLERDIASLGDDRAADVSNLARLAAALRSSADARALCRVRGGLGALLGRLGAKERPDAGALEQAYDGGFDLGDGGNGAGDLDAAAAAPAAPATGAAKALVLSTLAAAVRGEPKSKDLAVDGGALEEILTVFADDGGHFEHDAATRASACELVAELAAADGASDRARGLLAAHLPLLRRVAALARAGGPALARARATPAAAKTALPEVAAAAHALKCLRDLADDEAARATLLRVGDEGDVAVVEAVAVAAKAAVSVKAADRAAAARAAAKTHAKDPMAAMGDPAAMCEAIAGELADYGCACLARLAFSEQFRPAFAVAVAGARDARATPAGILLAAARDAGEAPEVRASALAAVTNACLGAEGSRAVQAAEAAGGVAVAYAFVRAPPAAGDDVRARAAGLLARLVTAAGHEGSAARTLRAAPGALPALAAVVDALSKLRGDAPAAEERDALVRAMAGALAADKDPDGAVRNFHAKGGYRVLAAILPRPRADLGAVTATSVSQPPVDGTRVSPSCACNAAKVLLAALSNDDAGLRGAVAADLAAHGGIEKLVCCLANYKEMPVRRNCAVCLAKLMAIDKDLAPRVRELRGVEMITTLGNALIA